jgi:hypothetical protein
MSCAADAGDESCQPVNPSLFKNVARLIQKQGDKEDTIGTAFAVRVNGKIFIISARHCILDETFDADGRSLNPPIGHVTANLFAFGQRLQYVGSRASDDVAVLRFESEHPDSGLPSGYALYNLDVERERQAVLGTEILIRAYPKVTLRSVSEPAVLFADL